MTAASFDPERWHEAPAYLAGFALFNDGRYFEAHEAWEEVWLATGRQGRVAALLKGLIKLAAAGVKARASRPREALSLVRGALRELAAVGAHTCAGLEPRELVAFAESFIEKGAGRRTGEIVFDRRLEPRRRAAEHGDA